MNTIKCIKLKLKAIIVLCFFLSNYTLLGQTITAGPTPITGHYPGGHVGLRGGETIEPGIAAFVFNRTFQPGNLYDDKGNNLGHIDKTSYALISGIEWNSKFKILGMTWGGLIGIPINDIYNRPSGQSYSSTGIGLGDIVIVPFGLYGKSKYFDYQIALGLWTATGAFEPGSPNNHGSGNLEILYSLGGAYYLKGDRRSLNFSAVARIEQNLKQKITEVDPGDDVIIDWGIASPYIPIDKDRNHIIDFGVSGFATTQFTKELGTYAALNSGLYRCFGAGPELNYIFRPLKLKLIIRIQKEFGARNTTEGMTYWFALAYKFAKM